MKVVKVCLALLAVLLAAAILLLAVSQMERRYDVVVSFGSICCGPNVKAMEELDTLVKRFEHRYRVRLEVRRKHWGLEGETELCINLQALPLIRRGHFIIEASNIVRRSEHTRLKLLSVCEGWDLNKWG